MTNNIQKAIEKLRSALVTCPNEIKKSEGFYTRFYPHPTETALREAIALLEAVPSVDIWNMARIIHTAIGFDEPWDDLGNTTGISRSIEAAKAIARANRNESHVATTKEGE